MACLCVEFEDTSNEAWGVLNWKREIRNPHVGAVAYKPSDVWIHVVIICERRWGVCMLRLFSGVLSSKMSVHPMAKSRLSN